MDSFTERMLERAKARQKKLEEIYINSNSIPKNTLQEPNAILKKYERISSHSPSNSPTRTLNIQKDNFNMEITVTSTDNVRLEVEFEEEEEKEVEDEKETQNRIEKDKLEQVNVQTRTSKYKRRSLSQMYEEDDHKVKKLTGYFLQKQQEAQTSKEKFKNQNNKGKYEGVFENRKKEANDEPRKKNSKVITESIEEFSDEYDKEKENISSSNEKCRTYKLENFNESEKNSNASNLLEKSGIRSTVKQRLDRLGQLYSGKDDLNLSSPIHKTEETFSVSEPEEAKKGQYRLGKLQDLAASRHKWEDEDRIILKKNKAPLPPSSSSISTLNEVKNADKESRKVFSPKKGKAPSPPSILQLDKKVINNLESQGFTRLNSNSKLVYKYSDNNKSVTAKISTTPTVKDEKMQKDPALLSVSERKALFERNKGEALLPKAPFAMSIPVNLQISKTTSQGGIASKMKELFDEKTTISQQQISDEIQQQKQKDLQVLMNRFHHLQNDESQHNKIENVQTLYDEENITDNDEDDNVTEMTNILPKHSEIKITSSYLNLSSTSKRRSASCEDSPKVRETLEDVKRIRVSPPKSGHIYPCLSDIEASATEIEEDEEVLETDTENDMEKSFESASEEFNTSFGREILQVVAKSQKRLLKRQKKLELNNDDDEDADNENDDMNNKEDKEQRDDLSSILDGMDDYLDEALQGYTTPKKQSISDHSDSFTFKKSSPESNKHILSDSFDSDSNSKITKSISAKKQNISFGSPKKEKLSDLHDTSQVKSPKKEINSPRKQLLSDSSENVKLPLMHTVSFYRKQQKQRTTIEDNVGEKYHSNSEDSDEDEETKVTQRINELLDVVTKQQTVISQASQALNLCCATIEFAGSTEQVEAERLLLVANERRQAALHEIQRLRVERCLCPKSPPTATSLEEAKGRIIISDVRLPLRREYMRALQATGAKGHHVVCIMRAGAQVQPTTLVTTADNVNTANDELCFPGQVCLEDVYANVTVKCEIYLMKAEEELLPHEVKYHISRSGTKHTPSKNKTFRTQVQSPGGPAAVRTSSFTSAGYIVFSLPVETQRYWTIMNVPAMPSPFEGSVYMRVRCQLNMNDVSVSKHYERRGFLTVFDDVSGFGAWHRRWCFLQGPIIYSWKYPDDEKKKAPITLVDLRECITKTIGPVNRETCARPHTILLETVRPSSEKDKNTLVTRRQGEQIVIRHLLAADTKQERIEWCNKLNKTLSAIRLWSCNNIQH